MTGYRGAPPFNPNYAYPPNHPQARARPDQPQQPSPYPPANPYTSYSQQYTPQAPQQQQFPLPTGAYPPGQTQGYVPYAQPQHAAYQRQQQPPYNAQDVRGMEYHTFPTRQQHPPIKYQAQEAAQPMMPPATAQMYWTPEEHNPTIPQQTRFNEPDSRTAAGSAFDRFDQDNSHYLDLHEFMDAIRSLHLAISYHEALDCFARSDTNEDGRIGRDEFIAVYVEMKRNSLRAGT